MWIMYSTFAIQLHAITSRHYLRTSASFRHAHMQASRVDTYQLEARRRVCFVARDSESCVSDGS